MNRVTEIHELKTAMQTTQNRRMYERYQVVLLVLEGRTHKEPADIINRTEHTVGKYVSIEETDGLPGRF